MKKILLFLPLLFILFFIPERVWEEEWFGFDTLIRVKVWGRNPWRVRKAIKEVKEEFSGLEKLASPYIQSGKIPPELKEMIQMSIYVASQTHGAFDPSTGPLMELWKRFKEPFLPSPQDIEKAKKFVDWRRVKIKGDSLILPPGFYLDLGGVAKGYAIEKGIEILKKHGIKKAIIDAGGDLGIMGRKPGGWKIGIQDPRNPSGILDTFRLEEGYVATSGDYQRYFILDGVRYHHILNPKTGYPARKSISCTVVGKNGALADAIATAVFVLGPDGMDIFPEVSIYLVDREGKVWKKGKHFSTKN